MFGANIEPWKILFYNIPIVGLGNYIGGAVFVGWVFWYAHLWRGSHKDFMYNVFVANVKRKFAKKVGKDIEKPDAKHDEHHYVVSHGHDHHDDHHPMQDDHNHDTSLNGNGNSHQSTGSDSGHIIIDIPSDKAIELKSQPLPPASEKDIHV